MRHRTQSRRLSRPRGHRDAVLHNLVSSLVAHGRIITTPVKAKEARRLADRLVTLAKQDTMAARRRADAVLQSKPMTRRLFREIGPVFRARQGGYTRMIRLARRRHGDGAELAVLEWSQEPASVEVGPEPTSKRTRTKRATKQKKPTAPPPAEAESPAAAEEAPAVSGEAPAKSPEATPQSKPRKFADGLRNFFRRGRDKKRDSTRDNT